MSLRLRTVLAIILVLLVGSIAGIGVADWQAKGALREELVAALSGGRQAVASGFQDLAASPDRTRDLRRTVSAFNGDRHLVAALMDARDHAVFTSRALAARPAPAWFEALFRFPMSAVRIEPPADDAYSIVLRPVLANDVGALWDEFTGLATVLAASVLAGSAFVWLTMGPALKPLSDFTAAFLRIGSGDYDVRVRENGPLELVRLGRAVNQMTARLQTMQARNQSLELQLSNLQDEERADLARDLHDEIGPQLFAANVDAAMVRRLIEEGRAEQGLDQVKAIQRAVAHMQTLVRDILGRLRPTQLVELGLASAIAELVEFWRSRRPGIRFELCLPPDEDLPHDLRETLYRVVQEGLNNAVRHGRPHRVEVEVAVLRDGSILAKVADDGAHAGTPGPAGFGLVGMRERVVRVGGDLTIDKGAPGRGWTVTAHLPSSEKAVRRAKAAA